MNCPGALLRRGILAALLLVAACASQPVSKVSDVPLFVSDPQAKAIVERYEEKARASSDPVLVWIPALAEENREVVGAGLTRTRGSGDERAIPALEEMIRRWKSKEKHDDVPLTHYAAIELDHLRAESAWKALHLDELSDSQRLDRLLEVAASRPGSEWLREKMFAEFLNSQDPRVVPFVVQFPRPQAWDKIHSFGKDAVPSLLEAGFKSERPLVRGSALSCLSRLRAPEGVGPMIEAVRNTRSEDVFGTTRDQWKSESLNSLKIALSGYGESILDRLKAEISAPDPLTRDSFLNIIASIGGGKALEILKSALPGETSRDNSDGINVQMRLNGYIQRVERGDK
jgi:hypothetical protein